MDSKYTNKLRSSGMRPTRQRIKICEILFDREHTFHFSINDLAEIVKNNANEKIALATIYNTAFTTKKGYLKEISINSDKSYFDTNTSSHHHFFDEETSKLIDLDNEYVDPINIRKNIPGKRLNRLKYW